MIKKIQLFVFSILISTILLSCGNNNSKISENTAIFQSFPHETSAIFKDYLKLENVFIRQLFLKDSSLILLDLTAENNYFFNQYSLYDKTLVRSFVKKGANFGEVLGGFTSGIYNKESFWFHDLSINRLVTAKIPINLFSKDSVKITQFKLPNTYYSMQLKDDSTLFASGSTRDKNKIQELNLNNGKEKNLFDIYYNCPKNMPYFDWKNVHEGFLFLKPTNDKLVLAYRLTDKIEVFDLQTNTSKIVSGPSNFEPMLQTIINGGKNVTILNEKAKRAFINGFVNNKYIYLLYADKFEIGPNQDQSNLIYVYDWNGYPVAKIKCNKEISAFTVSEDNTVIYAFDPISQHVIIANFKL